ncbi:DsbC family protein [soil metagenome]
MVSKNTLSTVLGLFLLAASWMALPVHAQEAQIRKNITARLPELPPIDEVSKTAMPGIYEVRFGTDLFYSDEQGNYLIQGNMIETKSRQNLTKARVDKLTEIDFAALPLQDAMVTKRGTGARKLVVFADPNCGYCKKFEQDIQAVKDVTIYTFLIPILGGDSPDKSRNIWCSKNADASWQSWMIDGKAPPRTMGACATPLDRNLALARKYKINGTPTVVFVDGSREPGAISADVVEKKLSTARAKS